MKAIINGIVFYQNQFMDKLVILYEDTIHSIVREEEYWSKYQNSEVYDAGGAYIIPGMIDVHIHGSKGADIMDASQESLENIKRYLVENGVTSFLATTMTMPIESIRNALQAVKECMDKQETQIVGAQIIGVHLEGPYICKEFKGAQNESDIIEPSRELMQEYMELLKVVTIAPEIPGAMELIREYHDQIIFSLGHSGADFEQGMEAFSLGAKGVTHMFNAMTGLHHRNPGLVGAAMASECYCELIADNHHVHPGIFSVLTRIKGLDKILLVTDCMRAGGFREGTYDLGGQEVYVANGQCKLANGTIAGSVLTLNEGLMNYKEATKSTLEQILPLVTINQARYLGMDDVIGSLEPGKRADIVWVDKDFTIKKTIVKGKIQYERQ